MHLTKLLCDTQFLWFSKSTIYGYWTVGFTKIIQHRLLSSSMRNRELMLIGTVEISREGSEIKLLHLSCSIMTYSNDLIYLFPVEYNA